MIQKPNPHVISINELGTYVPPNTIKKLLFSYYVFKAQGSNMHGRVAVAVDKQFHVRTTDHQHQPNIVTVTLTCSNKPFSITSVYSQPTELLPLQYMFKILKTAKSNTIVGDFNAKHEQWRCSLRNRKGRELEQRVQMNDLAEYNQGMTTSFLSKTTNDLIISNEQQILVQCQRLAYNGNDRIPIICK